VYERALNRRKIQLEHVDHIKVNHVENLQGFVNWNSAQKSSVEVVAHSDYGPQMTPEMLDKLDSLVLFLPELNMPVNTSGYNKIGACDHQVSYSIAVHVAFLIVLGHW